MSNNIKITDLPDGGCIVEMDGEAVRYSKEEIDEMEQDYVAAIRRALERQYAESKITLNEMRIASGLEPIDDPAFDQLVKRA
jgi:hypothetical protein